jgi:hypothetical protein
MLRGDPGEVLQLDMRCPPRPLPERIALTVENLYDPDFGPDELLARIAVGAGLRPYSFDSSGTGTNP